MEIFPRAIDSFGDLRLIFYDFTDRSIHFVLVIGVLGFMNEFKLDYR